MTTPAVFWAAVSFLISYLVGFMAVKAVIPHRQDNHGPTGCLFWPLSALLGTGISASIFTPVAFLPNLSRAQTMALDLGIHTLLLIVLATAGKSKNNTCFSQASNSSTLPGWMTKAFWTVVVLGLITSTLMVIQLPFGGHDAMGIWNAKARVLALGRQDVKAGLMAYSLHPDYPLLLPAAVARLWCFAGKPLWIVPLAVQWVLTYACIFLVAGTVTMIQGKKPGILAGIMLAGTPFYLREGASAQQADVVLASFIATSLALMAFYHAGRQSNKRLLFMSGFTAALAAWTKNEGLLFIFSLLLSQSLVCLSLRGWKSWYHDTAVFVFGAAPVLLLIIWFKLTMGQTTDIFALQNRHTLTANLFSLQRYLKITKSFMEQMFSPGRWQIYPLLMGLWLVVTGFRTYRPLADYLYTALLSTALVLGGYFAIYLITPLDLDYHIRTSLHRILLHLWPSIIMTFFLCFGQWATAKASKDFSTPKYIDTRPPIS